MANITIDSPSKNIGLSNKDFFINLNDLDDNDIDIVLDDENDENLDQFRPINNNGSMFTVNFHNNKTNVFDEEDVEENDENQKFKLPPRLAARLYKQQSNKILNNIENVQPPALIRRETMVLRKVTNNVNKNNLLNENRNANDLTNEFNEAKALKNKLNTDADDDLRYINWINSVIAQSFKIENITVDTARIINDCIMSESRPKNNSNNINNNFAALKDDITSIAYREEKLMDNLREKARNLYESDELKLVKEVLLEDLNVPRYYIRKDRSIHCDVGSKKHILELLINYNPLWLKVALETIFNQKINKSKNELHQLVQFLTHRLLSFKAIATKKNCKNVTTYFMNENNVISAKRHILYHFLMIVHFLDVAKRKRLIDHDPCLFRTNSNCKSSRDIILLFSRDYITGVGDITKSLRNAGIHLEYVQNSIEEFNFTAKKLSCDLRCGVRLARLSEIILQRNDILPRLYFPPNNITRKLHNIELVLKMLSPSLGDLGKFITPKEICIGVRNKTILLLDRLIEIHNIRLREIELQRSLNSIILIQRTFRRYLQCKADRSYFLKVRAIVIMLQQECRSRKQMRKDRNNFLKLRKATILIQQKFRANQAMKIEQAKYRKTLFAIILIQQKFRASIESKKQRNEYLKLRQAALVVQKRFRMKRQLKMDQQNYIKIQNATRTIQRYYRAYKQRQYFIALKKAVRLVENNYRTHLERRAYLKMRQSAIIIQRQWRLYYRRKELTKAALTVQRRFRANLKMKECRSQYQLMKRSAIKIQQFYRLSVVGREYRSQFLKMKHSAIMIEKIWRGYVQRKNYQKQKEMAIFIQQRFRANLKMKECRHRYQLMQSSAIKIQRIFRATMLMKEHREQFLRMKNSAIMIQKVWRGYAQRKCYQRQKNAAIIIQQRFRATILARIERTKYLKLRFGVILFQRAFRAKLRMIQMNKAASIIQQHYRAKKAMEVQRNKYQTILKSILIIQRRYRAFRIGQNDRKQYELLKQATIKIQRFYRKSKQLNHFKNVVDLYMIKIKNSAICIQKRYRGYITRKRLDEINPKFLIIRTRLEYINANVTEDKKLINVIQRSIVSINSINSVDNLFYDIKLIENGTMYPSICRIVAQHDWFIKKLLSAFKIFNRSEPHKKIIYHILGIFINLLEKTDYDNFYSNFDMLDTLVKIAKIFPKSDQIIFKTLYMLSILLQHKQTLTMFKRDKRWLQTIEMLVKKNIPTMNLKLKRQSSSSSSCLTKCNTIGSIALKLNKILT